jgi:hypothetical protein
MGHNSAGGEGSQHLAARGATKSGYRELQSFSGAVYSTALRGRYNLRIRYGTQPSVGGANAFCSSRGYPAGVGMTHRCVCEHLKKKGHRQQPAPSLACLTNASLGAGNRVGWGTESKPAFVLSTNAVPERQLLPQSAVVSPSDFRECMVPLNNKIHVVGGGRHARRGLARP